jgi:excinuclease ABC subunit C
MIDINQYEIPDTPGVYIFRNSKNRVIYVGKAINLKNRVKSYFQKFDALAPKTQALVEKIEKFEFIKVENEVEALLLEADLIKKYRPPYNIDLKDDKFYKYIKIEGDKLKLPNRIEKTETEKNLLTIGQTRKKRDDKAQYFGPFPEGSSVNLIIKSLRRVFPYRDCTTSKFNRYKKAGRPCLYGHIGLCPAPCQSVEAGETNNENVKKIGEYLKGNKKRLFQALEREMKDAAKREDFETAAYLRDQINSYNYLTQTRRDVKEYISAPNLVEDRAEKGLQALIDILETEGGFLFDPYELETFRIEVFDISNIQGSNAVGSMVVMTGGSPDKKEYRRFKIQTKDTPDDFHMMQEMLRRRLKRVNMKDEDKWLNPNLIVIDGGKGQLSSAIEILEEYNLDIPIIGLAKREEEIVVKTPADFKIIKLPDSSEALNILKRGRDEAHRFGITYYRKLHRKSMYN